MSRPTALVTGALGQDGFILCQRLRANGEEVIAVVRPGSAQHARRIVLEQRFRCRIAEVDLAHPAELAALVARVRPQSIYHLAAAHHASQEADESAELWKNMISVNFSAPEEVARTLVSNNIDCAFVFASSSQIWTRQAENLFVDESTPPKPSTFYARTKVWAGELLSQYRDRYGLRASIAFLFNHESRWRSPPYVTRKITLAAARASLGDPTPLHLSNIGACVDWQAATDVVDGLILMAHAPDPDDYILASGVGRTVRDFVETAYGHVEKDWEASVTYDHDRFVPAVIGVAKKAAERLGWRQKSTFEGLVIDMVDADLLRQEKQNLEADLSSLVPP